MKRLGVTFVGNLTAALMALPAVMHISIAEGTLQQNAATSPEGAALYQERCSACHDNPQERVAPLFLIRRRSAEDVIQTLTTGAMKQQAAGLSAAQIRALAVFLTGKQPGTAVQVSRE